jgi:hypothetical protein
MTNNEQRGADLRELVLNDLRSRDDAARAAFSEQFDANLRDFGEATVAALSAWSHFREEIDDTDERRVAVTAVTFTAISQNISSYKLFMTGYTVASGALFRQVLEGVSLACLCAARSLTVLDRFLANRYSANRAVTDLARHASAIRVNRDAARMLLRHYDFYHKYAHLTPLTIAAGANFALGGVPNVGAHFDPVKLPEYQKEVRSRVSFARALPNFVKGVAKSVASW